VKVAAVQWKAIKGDKPASLARLASLAREAAAGADLVVLPEMAATGYVFENREAIAPLAEPAQGETFQTLAAVARAANCWIVSGFAERDGDRLYNSAHVISPTGMLHVVYRKMLLYDTDKSWASPGDRGYVRVETPAGGFTVGICMDLNDDRFIRWCRAAAVRAIAFPTNWLDQGQNVWPYWAWRLAGVPSTLVAANTYGPEAHLRFIGGSAILSGPKVLAAAPPSGDCILHATLDEVPAPPRPVMSRLARGARSRRE
jgi:predicted amidohydrolase